MAFALRRGLGPFFSKNTLFSGLSQLPSYQRAFLEWGSPRPEAYR